MSDSSLSRRDVFRLFAAATAAGAMLPKEAAAQAPLPLTRNVKDALSDPDYSQKVIPWEQPLTPPEVATLAILCDLILPGDGANLPMPSKIGVPDFLNEWVGAPYKDTIEDLETIRGGLAWLQSHSNALHQKRFDDLTETQQTAILDSICDAAKTAPELAAGNRFFKRLRMLTLGGYYTHSSTWKSLGYVGNTPIAGAYPGVPDEVIRLLGLEDVV
jgi:hypothetical protein